MTRKQIDALADEFHMTERLGSPFGSPHYVNDAKGAELELIVSRENLHVSLLFEAESMSHLNYCKGQPIAECSGDAVRMELQRLSRRRSSREMESIMELELEAA
jgi:hypothetical protein